MCEWIHHALFILLCKSISDAPMPSPQLPGAFTGRFGYFHCREVWCRSCIRVFVLSFAASNSTRRRRAEGTKKGGEVYSGEEGKFTVEGRSIDLVSP